MIAMPSIRRHSLKRTTRARRSLHDPWNELRKLMRNADVILEVVDARDIAGTRLPLAEKWAGSNRLVAVANKSDLAVREPDISKLPTRTRLLFSAVRATEGDRRILISYIMNRAKGKKQPVRALLVGYPNIGKSSIINLLAKRQAAKVSPVAGTTKNVQWININEGLTITDYRGIYPEKETREALVRKGAVNVDADALRHAYMFAKQALKVPVLREWLCAYYDIDLTLAKDQEEVLTIIARRRGWLLKGGEPNLDEAARHLVRAMREAPVI